MRLIAGFIAFLTLVSIPPYATSRAVADDNDDARTADAAAPHAAGDLATDGLDGDDECDASSAEVASPESHRRRAAKGKSVLVRPASTPQAGTTAIERLEELCSGEVVLQPIIVRSTLADAMRRVALWGDCCPICGHAQPGKDKTPAKPNASADQPGQRKLLEIDLEEAKTGAAAAATPLQPGEPAQVILDTQKRLGSSVTEGTEFGGSPELLIQWIRTLDEENRRRQVALEEEPEQEPVEADETEITVTARTQVDALRLACRQLQEAADLLEDQNLFESADLVRVQAEALRRQSRQKIARISSPDDDPPAAAPRQARSKR